MFHYKPPLIITNTDWWFTVEFAHFRDCTTEASKYVALYHVSMTRWNPVLTGNIFKKGQRLLLFLQVFKVAILQF